MWNVRQRFKARQLIEMEKKRITVETCRIDELFELDDDLASMRRRYSVEFLQVFNMGYQNYSEGEWRVARRLLMRTYSDYGFKDGPSGALLTFMELPHQFEVPKDWRG